MLILLLLACLLRGATSARSSLSTRRAPRPVPSNPFDHTWITEWAAVGDSFTSSVGAGKRVSWWCSRYDQGFPNLINDDYSLRDSPKLNYLGCLGHTTGEIRTKQIDTLSAQQDMITLTGGGNDLDFGRIVQLCVYNWVAFQEHGACQTTIEKTKQKVESEEFAADLTALIEAAKSKLSPDLRGKVAKVFWLSYVNYFDTRTKDCDTVTWSFKVQDQPPYLTQGYRRQLNQLVDMANRKIKEVAAKAGPDVVVVDWQKDLDALRGRFCWPQVDETPGKGDNREMLGLYEWYSTLDDDLFGNSQSIASFPTTIPGNSSANDLPVTEVPRDQMGPYQAQLVSEIATSLRNGSASFPGYNDGKLGLKTGDDAVQVASWLSDKILRTFHPQSNAHVLMANAVLKALEDTQANAIKPGSHATSVTYGHCAASTTLTGVMVQSHARNNSVPSQPALTTGSSSSSRITACSAAPHSVGELPKSCLCNGNQTVGLIPSIGTNNLTTFNCRLSQSNIPITTMSLSTTARSQATDASGHIWPTCACNHQQTVRWTSTVTEYLPVTTYVSTTFSSPTPTSSQPTPSETCYTSWEPHYLYGRFDIYGASWDTAKLYGDAGAGSSAGLGQQLKDCDGIINVQFETLTPDSNSPWDFHASGMLDKAAQDCFEKAIASAGAPNLGCDGLYNL